MVRVGGRIRTVWKRYKCVVWAVVRALRQRASDLMCLGMYHSFREVPQVECNVGTRIRDFSGVIFFFVVSFCECPPFYIHR